MFVDWLKQGRSPVTVKRYLEILKALDKTAFADFKVKIPAKPMPKPFSKAEVDAILQTMKANKYYSHYHDFTAFLFSTGVRTSEAIGLQWKHVDLVRGEIDIYESLGRHRGSSSNRERRSTKTNNARVLPCRGRLAKMLSDRKPKDANPEDLVFTSPTGKHIDDHLYSQRCWRKTLELAGVEYRNPYKTRHTFISHCLEAGIKPITVAYLVGHADTSMIFTRYAGVINKPDLPELF
ncbi:site-specific integrase [Crinalium epipsammum]|uniref:site-specific integrase n=1 Tax=Crinalium epipsammum TaxID=241425 RepID=UPI0006864AFE|nr:site-specific integrase [Crinalium epipsammum]